MTHPFRASVVLVAGLVAYGSLAHAQTEPPGRVGRLAFTEGSVSFHDRDDVAWTKAVINMPLTSGDSVWTEPNARSELSVAGTRLRLDGSTQLDVLALDDKQTRLQLARGRLDVKTYTLDMRTPYQIVTPRGTITLQQQGDYYLDAGSAEEATRLGVRSGSARMRGLDGQSMTIGAGEVGEILGDVGALQLRAVNSGPPPLPSYWAVRDRQVTYDPPTQYLSASITGYEDLNAYGSWSKDSEYGDVWTPRSVPANWQPYRTGHWSNVKPWGWTWIDDQPWGYAPYHYGRWAHRNNRWVWVPPQRDAPPVYAPALVAFIGGIELAVTLGNQSNSPIGWFPLGPRETYMPSYTTDRDYYNRINQSAQIQQNVLDDRWQRMQRYQSAPAASGNVLLNQRFATIVPTETFVSSQPVARAVLKAAPEQIAAAPVALVAAPPAPTASLALSPAPAPGAKTPEARAGTSTGTAKAPDAKTQADAKTNAAAPPKAAPQPTVPVANATPTAMPTLAKPAVTDKPAAAGPQITVVTPGTVPGAQPSAPPLPPRSAAAPPTLKDEKAPATPSKTGRPEAGAPTAAPAPTAPAPLKPDVKSDAKPLQAPAPSREPNDKDTGARKAAAPAHPVAPQATAAPGREPPAATHNVPAIPEPKSTDLKKKIDDDKIAEEKK
jgi:hypothetical protein